MLDDEGQPVLEPLTKHDTIFAGTLVDPFNGKVLRTPGMGSRGPGSAEGN